MRARLVAGLVTLIVVATLPAPASAARPRTWDARVFSAPDGSDIRFTTIAEDGAAAGIKVLPDGTPKAVYFNGRRLVDLSPRLGVVSSIAGLNGRHQAAGYASSNPAARVANLFDSAADPALIPRAFFLSGRTVKRLSMPSAAFGINISGDVAGTFRASDGLLHAFLWRPGSKGDRRFVDLGGGDARALNDPAVAPRRGRRSAGAARVQSLMTIVGGNSIWRLNIVTGRLIRRLLPQQFFLQSVSNIGLASGGQDRSDGSRDPVHYDVDRGIIRMPLLPDGFPDGFASGVSRSTNLTSGSVTSGTEQHGFVWRPNGSVFGDVNSLPGISLPAGTAITNVPAVSDTGLLAGFGVGGGPGDRQYGVVVYPPPAQKVSELVDAWEAYLDQWDYPGSRTNSRDFTAPVRDAFKHWDNGRKRLACHSIREAVVDLAGISHDNYDDAFDRLYTGKNLGREESEKIARPALAIELKQAFAEFVDELDCPSVKKSLGLIR